MGDRPEAHRKRPAPQSQPGPGLSGDEIEAEQAQDLPDREAMTVLDPTSLVSGGALTNPTGSGIEGLSGPPSGVSLPGIGTLGLQAGPTAPTEPTIPST